MQIWVLKECLRQLMKIYVFAEQQYVHSTIDSNSSVLQIFFRQHAFERSDFILKIQREIDFLESNCSPQKSIEAFYQWHDAQYANANLKDWPVTDNDAMVIDEKALEICNCPLNDSLPDKIHDLTAHQTIRLESSLLSLANLKALEKNR